MSDASWCLTDGAPPTESEQDPAITVTVLTAEVEKWKAHAGRAYALASLREIERDQAVAALAEASAERDAWKRTLERENEADWEGLWQRAEQERDAARAALAEAHRTLTDVEKVLSSIDVAARDLDDGLASSIALKAVGDVRTAIAASRSGAESAGEQQR